MAPLPLLPGCPCVFARHPDKNNSEEATEKFQMISAAYARLTSADQSDDDLDDLDPSNFDVDDLFGDMGIDPMLFFAMLFGGRGGGIHMAMGPRGPVMFMSPGMAFGGGPFGGGGRRQRGGGTMSGGRFGGPPPRGGPFGGGGGYYEGDQDDYGTDDDGDDEWETDSDEEGIPGGGSGRPRGGGYGYGYPGAGAERPWR